VNPSGRLPVTLPRSAGAQPYSYLHPPLGGPTTVSNLPTAPGLPFGHGLSNTTFEHADLAIAGDVEAGGSFVTTVRVTNTGPRAGTDVVQLYGHDVVASITRPTAQLLGYRRLALEPGESAVVRFVVQTARLAFSDRDLVRVVEPGDVELWVGPSCEARETEARLRITGQTHQITVEEPRWTTSEFLLA
jgi:hypothetical protein